MPMQPVPPLTVVVSASVVTNSTAAAARAFALLSEAARTLISEGIDVSVSQTTTQDDE